MPRHAESVNGALVLAAGFGRRFGGGKLTAPMADGRCLIEHTLTAIAAAIDEILIVTRAGALEDWDCRDWPTLQFDRAEQGMGASLAWGIAHLPPWRGCLVCLADMPFVRPRSYRVLAEHLTRGNIVVPRHGGQRGHPVGFGREFFPELEELRGERGGRDVIRQYADSVLDIEVNDPGILDDIDTVAELDRRC